MTVRVKAGGKTIAQRRVRVRFDCTYTATFSFKKPERRTLTVQARFDGTAKLLPARAVTTRPPGVTGNRWAVAVAAAACAVTVSTCGAGPSADRDAAAHGVKVERYDVRSRFVRTSAPADRGAPARAAERVGRCWCSCTAAGAPATSRTPTARSTRRCAGSGRGRPSSGSR